MARPSGLLDVFAVQEFRALWSADTLSTIGDQLARVALAVLVYERTSSATLTALVYGLTMLPTIVGGILLSGLADRRPRRDLMVTIDVVRLVLAGLLAVPGTPLWTMCVLVFTLTLIDAPYRASAMALMPSMLEGELYPKALAVRSATYQIAQVVGFAGGGTLIALLDPSIGLAANAATFGVAALVIRFGLRSRPAPGDPAARPSWFRSIRAGAGLVWSDRRLRWLTALTWLVGVFTVPEALAAPYADEVMLGAVAVGLLMAADPIGSAIGVTAFTRWVPADVRPRLIGALAVLSAVPLVFTVLQPSLAVTVLLWALSGACSTAYITQAQASFVPLVPDAQRGQAVGMVRAGLVASQGGAIMLGGIAADLLGVALAITVAAAVGGALAIPAGLAWSRARSRPSVVEVAGTEHRLGARDHVPVRATPSSDSSIASSTPPPGDTSIRVRQGGADHAR